MPVFNNKLTVKWVSYEPFTLVINERNRTQLTLFQNLSWNKTVNWCLEFPMNFEIQKDCKAICLTCFFALVCTTQSKSIPSVISFSQLIKMRSNNRTSLVELRTGLYARIITTLTKTSSSEAKALRQGVLSRLTALHPKRTYTRLFLSQKEISSVRTLFSFIIRVKCL